MRRRVSRSRIGFVGWGERKRAHTLTAVAALATFAALAVASPAAGAEQAPPLPPIDPQNWTMPDDMTWAEYQPVPGTDWANPTLQPTIKRWRAALVFMDFPNQEPVISQPARSTIFGNPQAASDVPRAEVPRFYADLLNTPSMLNHFVTMNKYWMENSLGRYGVELVPFGVYRLAGQMFEYHLRDAGGAGSACPAGFGTCSRNFRSEALAAWRAAEGPTIDAQFDNVFYVSAGQDESSTWQEFGEMMFQTRDDVTEAFGNPDPTKTNWAPTRYVPWTSFASATTIWPSASGTGSTEAESSGMGTFAHELSHNLGIGDNYNNPYGVPLRRSYTGPWDMLSRGSFNGPGGPHTRWHIPSVQGGSLGSNHNLRNRIKLAFVTPENLLLLDRDALATSGTIVAKVTTRAADPGPSGLTGINLALTGGDRSPACSTSTQPDCPGSGYQNYTLEVVQRIGNDSFTPGHGLLISKTKNTDSAPFVWIIDAHPADFNRVDFLRPNGEPAMISFGDYRQLGDATFNAGLNSGTKFEYVDEANGVQFYVVDVDYDEQGVLSYTLGVRSLSGDGLHTRDVEVDSAGDESVSGLWTYCNFPVTNTGSASVVTLPVHPEDVSAYLTSDVYRLAASAEGEGWSAQLANALAAVQTGQTVNVPVYVTRVPGSAAAATVTLTATSESDRTKAASSTCSLAALEPDLEVTAIDVKSKTTSTGLRQGDTALVTATVTNAGDGPAAPSQTAFLLDGSTLLGLVATPELPAGGSATVSVEWVTEGVKGEHTIRVTADQSAELAESDESNNASTLTVTVKGNKVTNGSFEQSSGSSPSGWSGSSTDAGSTSYDGSAVSITGTGVSVALAGAPSWTSTPIGVTAGEALQLVVSVRSASASSPGSAGLAFLSATGQVAQTVSLLTAPLTTAGVRTLEQAVTVPAGATQVRVVLSAFAPTDLATAGTVTFEHVGLYSG